MPDQAHDRDDGIVNAETQHEKSDVNVRALAWALVIFIVFAAVTHGLLYLQFHFFVRYFRGEASQPLTMMARPSDASIPATPRLQPFPTRLHDGAVLPPNANTPATDMEEMRAAEEQALNHPGWVDRQKGVVRLPIDVAKQLVVQRGLPVVKETTP
ncbi:MAG: hypothetical protein M3P29_00765 [Acidobacteriota bacterium]|nr:hypothetical protein [Acidobacteriota bacterium]